MSFCFSRYEPERDEWQLVAPMQTQRIGVGVAMLNRLLYAVGGYDGTSRHSSAECYYPEQDKWEAIAPMKTIRSGAGESDHGKSVLATTIFHCTYFSCCTEISVYLGVFPPWP